MLDFKRLVPHWKNHARPIVLLGGKEVKLETPMRDTEQGSAIASHCLGYLIAIPLNGMKSPAAIYPTGRLVYERPAQRSTWRNARARRSP